MNHLKSAVLASVLFICAGAGAAHHFWFEAIVTSSPDAAISVPGDVLTMEFSLQENAPNEHPDPQVAYNSSQVFAASAYINGTRFPDVIYDSNTLAIVQQPVLDKIEWIASVPGQAAVRAFIRFSPGFFPDFPGVEDILFDNLQVNAGPNNSSLEICYTQLDCISAVPITMSFANPVFEDDTDGDGRVDTVDNCIEDANTDQRDTDGDGYGNRCDADLNNDCIVNAVDIGLIKAVFFTADADADFDGDGIVNAVDLGIIKALFFGPPGPSAVGECP